MPFLCFLKGMRKRLGKRFEGASSPKVPSELQQERWKISSVNYWSETRLPYSVCQETICPLAPPWKCDEAAETVSGFPGRYTMPHVLVFFLLMPSPAGTGEEEADRVADWGGRGELTGWRGGSKIWYLTRLHSAPYTCLLVSEPHTNLSPILPRFQVRILTKCYLSDGCEAKVQGAFMKSTTAFNTFAQLSDCVLILAHGMFF